MKKNKLNNCAICEPISNFLNTLVQNDFVILEKQVEDPHFHQLYFKLKGDLSKTKNINTDFLIHKDGIYLCECHWSRIELVNDELKSTIG